MSLEMNANLTKMYDFAKTAIGHEALSGEDSVIQTRRNAPGLVGRKWTKASATRASTRMPRRFHRLRPHLQLTLRIPAPFIFNGVRRELKSVKYLLRRGKSAVQIRRPDNRLDRIGERLRVPRQFRRFPHGRWKRNPCPLR